MFLTINNMAYCSKCGTQLSEGVKYCPKCGKSIDEERGELTIKWDGQWMLFDAKIHIRVDGIEIGAYSFKKGFEVTIPITSNRMLIDVKCTIRSYQPILIMNPSVNHTLYIIYSRFTGGFDFVLVDNNGKRIQ